MATREERNIDNMFYKYIDYQGNWLEKARGNLMVVATVIATMSFQVAVNPPGGVWQSDSSSGQGCSAKKICKAGTSVFSYTNHTLYMCSIITSTVSFTSSLAMILFLIVGFTTKHKVFMLVLMMLMFLAVICMAGTYMISFVLVGGAEDEIVQNIAETYGIFWIVLFSFFFVFYVIKLIFWLLKKLVMCLFHSLCFLFKSFARRRTRSHRPGSNV